METLVNNTINWHQFVNNLTNDLAIVMGENKRSDKYFRERIYDELTNCLFSIDGNLNSLKIQEIEEQFNDNVNQFLNPIFINDPTSSNFILEGEMKFDEADEIDVDNLRLLREDTTPYEKGDYDKQKSFWYKVKDESNFDLKDIAKLISLRFGELKPYGNNDKIILLDSVSPLLYKELIYNPRLLKTMTWRLFEKLLADILETHGYTVQLMQGSKDNNIDIIAFGRKNNITGTDKYIIQAKRYENNKIEVDTVRSLVFTHMHEKATKSILATTSEFTAGAWKLSKIYEWMIELKDFGSIQNWIENTARIKRLI